MKYSPQTGSFYPADIAYAKIPDDTIEVTAEDFSAAMARGPADTLTVIDGSVKVVPYSGPTLDEARAAQISIISAAFAASSVAPVTIMTAAGATAHFAQTDQARSHLATCIAAGADAWTANVWLDADNAPVIPFTFSDLQALSSAIDAAHAPSYSGLLEKVAAIAAATTVAEVQAITF